MRYQRATAKVRRFISDMSDRSGGPAPKKRKQVLLGSWLNQSGASNSDAIDVNNLPPTARRPSSESGCASGDAARGSGMGSAGGGGGEGGGGRGGDAWAKYEAPRGGYRPGNNNNNSSNPSRNAERSSASSSSSYSASASTAASSAFINNNNNYNKNGSIYGNSRAQSSFSQTAPNSGAVSSSVTGGRGGGGGGGGGGGIAIDLAGDDDMEGSVGGGEGAEPVTDGLGLEELCEEQRHVIDLVLKGKSVFFTGAAGTGKSFLLKKLHQALKNSKQEATTFMTGTTGKAAVGIGGCTVHSFAGIGLGKEPVEQLVGRVQRSRQAQKRWAQCKVLVIDEISMMEADLFDKLNLVGQRMKGNSQPFGGVQLVLCGDFFQLPPVGIGHGSTRFCFEAKTWDTSIDQSIVLKQVFRQKDPFFLKILHEMREGRVSPEAQNILAAKVEQCRFERYQRANASSAAPGAADPAARAESGGGDASSPPPPSEAGGGAEEGGKGGGGAPAAAPPRTYTRLFSRNEDVDRLNVEELKKLEGKAEFYDATDSGDPTYLKQLQKHCAAGERIELKVGAKVLLLKNLDSSSQLVNGATGVVTEFVEASGRRLPMVEFDTMEGGGKVATVIREEEWSISLGDREMARRVQLPLRLAWALSVHKSQGMTIANVMVSTQGMFEYGQAYVALSRATTLDGLHLLDFRVNVVKAHDSVKTFYGSLERRAASGGSAVGGVTAASRQGQAAPKPGEWISRSSPRQAASSASFRPYASQTSGGAWNNGRGGAGGAGGAGGGRAGSGAAAMSPAARARMEENRKRALEKLAEKKRAKALETGSAAGRLGL